MAAPKRSQAEIDRDRAYVAKAYLKGVTQQEIADTLGVSRQQVGYDLKVLKRQWRQSAERDFATAQAEALEEIRLLKREAWDAWERSKADRVRPELLGHIGWAIDRGIKVQGLDAPTKVAPTDPTGDLPWLPVETLQRRSKMMDDVQAVLDRMHSGEATPLDDEGL